MKSLILALLFLFPSVGYSTAVETCWTDFGYCQVSVPDPFIGQTLYLPERIFNNLPDDVKQEMYELEYTKIMVLTDTLHNQFRSEGIPSQELSAEVSIGDLASFDSDARSVLKDAVGCVGGVVTCSGVTLSISATGILGYLGAKAACTAAALYCADSFSSYQEWEVKLAEKRKLRKEAAEKKKKEEEEAKAKAAAGGGNPGGVVESDGASSAISAPGTTPILPTGHVITTDLDMDMDSTER